MLPVTRRLSGDSDSSTASSKGGGGGGPRFSRRSGEEVVLLVNRKEGKHVIERPGGGAQIPSLRPPLPRARSHSRERPAPAPILKPIPPQAPSDGIRTSRTERGRSLGNEGPRRFQVPRSHSQGKLPSRRATEASPSPSPRFRDPQPPPSERWEGPRVKQVAPASPRISGGFSRRQSSSCSNSPIKGVQNSSSGSPSKKTVVTPRPPAPRSPSVGKSRLLPPVTSGGRRSPHSVPRSSHHHGPRSPRSPHVPRSTGRGHHRGRSGLELQEPEEEEEGLGFGFQMLPSLDHQKEQDLYRSFEAEFLANTQQAKGGPSRAQGAATLQLPASTHSQQGVGTLTVPAAADPNVTDSAYSSSNSSTSSLNVGAKIGALPDLRESKRTNARHYPLEDSLALLHGHGPGVLHNGGHGEPEHWGERGGGLRKLPAISSSMEESELLSTMPGLADTESAKAMNQLPSQPPFHSRNMNGGHGGCPPAGVLRDSQQGQLGWGLEPEGDVPLEDHQPNLPYDLEPGEPNDDLPPPEACPSPVALPPSEDGSFQDSSSETSSMCFSLSESRSESSPPPPPLANGGTDGGVVLRPKRGQKKADRVPSIYKLKLRPRIRPRTDNRPENSPSRIPTPVSYRDLQAHDNLSPCQTPPLSPQSSRSNGHPALRKGLHQAFADLIHPQPCSTATGTKECSFPGEPGSLDTDAWM